MTGPGERLFARLVRLYPREFRERYRDDLVAFFRQDREHPKYGSGPLRPVRFWFATMRDLARAAWREHRASLYVNGDSVRAMHVRNAHTDGDVIVTFQKADVVHMGDIFFNGLYPLVDVSSGGSVNGMIAAADKVLSMTGAKTRFIPGHGPLASRDDLVRYRNMLKATRDRVARLVAQRRSLAQALAAKPSADYDAVWGKGFLKPDQFVTILYNDLARSRGASPRR